MPHKTTLEESTFFENNGYVTSGLIADCEVIYSNPKTHSEILSATRRGRRIIIKRLKAEYRSLPEYRTLLAKEFEIGYQLSHSNIVQTVAFETMPEGDEAIILEYIDGITLSQAAGSLKRGEALKIVCELCDAMHYMHSHQIIHRDIKPENIMLTHNGQNVKLIDFGLADSDSHTIFKQPAGTRSYASPEQLAGERLDNRSDIYALGIIINQLLHDRHSRRVAARCMEEHRELRYSNALEVKQALQRPRYVMLYASIALAVVAIVISLYAALSSSHSDTQLSKQYNAVAERMERIIDEEYERHYAALDTMRTIEEFNAFALRSNDLYFALHRQASALLADVVDTTTLQYRELESTLHSSIQQRQIEYHDRSKQRFDTAYKRILEHSQRNAEQ